ncbi:sugar-binding protein [Candidatus Hydrogenedentota bacterium]
MKKTSIVVFLFLVVFTIARPCAAEDAPYVCRKVSQTIVIDASLDDWDLSSPVVLDKREQLAPPQRNVPIQWRGPSDLSARFHLCADDTNLYLAARVTDDHVTQPSPLHHAFGFDAVELLLDVEVERDRGNGLLSTDDYRFIFVPVAPDNPGQPLIAMSRGPKHTSVTAFTNLNEERHGARIDSRSTNDGYIVEAALPFGLFGNLVPRDGNTIGFVVSARDRDINPDDRMIRMNNVKEHRVIGQWSLDPATFAPMVFEGKFAQPVLHPVSSSGTPWFWLTPLVILLLVFPAKRASARLLALPFRRQWSILASLCLLALILVSADRKLRMGGSTRRTAEFQNIRDIAEKIASDVLPFSSFNKSGAKAQEELAAIMTGKGAKLTPLYKKTNLLPRDLTVAESGTPLKLHYQPMTDIAKINVDVGKRCDAVSFFLAGPKDDREIERRDIMVAILKFTDGTEEIFYFERGKHLGQSNRPHKGELSAADQTYSFNSYNCETIHLDEVEYPIGDSNRHKILKNIVLQTRVQFGIALCGITVESDGEQTPLALDRETEFMNTYRNNLFATCFPWIMDHETRIDVPPGAGKDAKKLFLMARLKDPPTDRPYTDGEKAIVATIHYEDERTETIDLVHPKKIGTANYSGNIPTGPSPTNFRFVSWPKLLGVYSVEHSLRAKRLRAITLTNVRGGQQLELYGIALGKELKPRAEQLSVLEAAPDGTVALRDEFRAVFSGAALELWAPERRKLSRDSDDFHYETVVAHFAGTNSDLMLRMTPPGYERYLSALRVSARASLWAAVIVMLLVATDRGLRFGRSLQSKLVWSYALIFCLPVALLCYFLVVLLSEALKVQKADQSVHLADLVTEHIHTSQDMSFRAQELTRLFRDLRAKTADTNSVQTGSFRDYVVRNLKKGENDLAEKGHPTLLAFECGDISDFKTLSQRQRFFGSPETWIYHKATNFSILPPTDNPWLRFSSD